MGTQRALEDRRKGARRETERLLHYAEQNLIATALNWHDARDGETPDVERVLFTSDRLHEAAERFREARDALAPELLPYQQADARWLEEDPQSPPDQSPPSRVSETDESYRDCVPGDREVEE